ncbi:SDR family NAD(P)-dependent oxidoreductase [Aquibacillus albus]|uniref:Short-subunit dehydrogenase n=1 Tax=Aquibacillus albus TaxID=1168171 RepID=A0ABS2MV23_9BACI|nr:SDR family oxidoreductase [Aquibacillus albus]MBM7569752.1 short-subunit dehydrogenase [Aquibacillus albus]
MANIHSKNIIITGASYGIGESLARIIAQKGGNPILIARTEDKLQKLQQQVIKEFNVRCSYYVVDLTDIESWQACLDRIIAEYSQIDAIINNAGYGIFKTVEQTEWEEVERMFQLNVFALIKGTHHLLPHFIQNRHGHVINIASQAGKIATPKSAVYGATKHAVIGFTNALRLEVENQGVLVTSVNLGPIRTNFYKVADPSGKYQQSIRKIMLNPEYVANKIVAILFERKREVNMPQWMNFGSKCYQIFPNMLERLLKNKFYKK